MPPKYKFSKDNIISAALDITRECGADAVTARSVGARLGASPKVIFGQFENMEQLQFEVTKAAYDLYKKYTADDMAENKYPPYKASGMAYIRFAKEEAELFKLLFMRDRSQENISSDTEFLDPIIGLIQNSTGLNKDDASFFHLEMWLYVHGIASTIATSYMEFDTELISRLLSDVFQGLKARAADRK